MREARAKTMRVYIASRDKFFPFLLESEERAKSRIFR
jgi:hypothetical protein